MAKRVRDGHRWEGETNGRTWVEKEASKREKTRAKRINEVDIDKEEGRGDESRKSPVAEEPKVGEGPCSRKKLSQREEDLPVKEVHKKKGS